MFYLIAYDISDTKKRNKVVKVLESYGYRVNYSVFELNLKAKELESITNTLKEYIDTNDSIRVYSFSADTIAKSYELNPKRSHPFELGANYVS